jgi:hypothetical protein
MVYEHRHSADVANALNVLGLLFNYPGVPQTAQIPFGRAFHPLPSMIKLISRGSR